MLKRFVALAALAAVMVSLVLSGAAQGQPAPTVYGLTANNALVRFAGNAPGTIQATTPITGLQGGDSITGIDFRPANGMLYGVGSSGRLYTINLQSGAATLASTLSAAPSGAAYGVDFNPVPDRLRVVSDEEQNLRVNVDTGEAMVDGTLAYAGGDANAGTSPTVVAAGYTNSVAGATMTTLYVIDSGLDILARQDPPNDGVLNTIGALGVDASALVGFDIAPAGNAAYAAISMSGMSSSALYTIDLNSGRATSVGAIARPRIGCPPPIAPGDGGMAAAPAAKPGAQPSPAPAAKPGAPAPAAKPAAAPVQMPQALPRTGVVEDWAIGGLAAAGAILLGAGMVARRRRA